MILEFNYQNKKKFEILKIFRFFSGKKIVLENILFLKIWIQIFKKNSDLFFKNFIPDFYKIIFEIKILENKSFSNLNKKLIFKFFKLFLFLN